MFSENFIGQRLRKLRLAHKLTQQEMANIFFTTRSSIANYEAGTRQPNYDLLLRIADYFQIGVHYLLGDSENPAQRDLSRKLISSAKLLTKDAKLDISSLSALHKIMVIEFINYLRMTEDAENLAVEDNA